MARAASLEFRLEVEKANVRPTLFQVVLFKALLVTHTCSPLFGASLSCLLGCAWAVVTLCTFVLSTTVVVGDASLLHALLFYSIDWIMRLVD